MEVVNFLKRTSERNGFVRDRFEEKNIPTDHEDLIIMPFFGDIRSLFVMSSLLLHRYKEEVKGSRYFILASWPGFQGMFPYVNEYWSLSDRSQLKRFYEQSDDFKNRSDLAKMYFLNFGEFFREVVDYREILPYYDLGIKQGFFDKFKIIKRFLPFIPSITVLGKDFNQNLHTLPGYKVFLHPSMYCKQWYLGRTKNILCKKEFWTELVKNLLKNGYIPVVWQNYLSYDISQEFGDKCLFVTDPDIIKVLVAMRATGCVLDVFNGLSRLALAARCPFVCVDERSRYVNLKETEIDDLCGIRVPHEYIFTFSAIISEGYTHTWESDIFLYIMQKLNVFLPTLNRDEWPSTAEVLDVVSYRDTVRKRKNKKLGTRLLKVDKL